MRPEAPIRIIAPKVDAYTKQARTRPYAEFDVQGLGIESIEGQDVRSAPPVRLPEPIEPGVLLDLYVAPSGRVVASESDKRLTPLFDTPVLIVTELLTVQLVRR